MQHTTVFAVEHEEVVRLHQHVVEFKERKSFFHTRFVAFRSQHFVDGEASAYFAQEIDVVEVEKPIRVVHDDGGIFAFKADKTRHLLFETSHVVCDCFFCHHTAQIGTTGRVANHRRASAYEDNRLVTCVLQTLCDYHLHKMTYMQAVRRRVKTDIKALRTAVKQLFEFFFVNGLFDQSAFSEFVDDVHFGHIITYIIKSFENYITKTTYKQLILPKSR